MKITLTKNIPKGKSLVLFAFQGEAAPCGMPQQNKLIVGAASEGFTGRENSAVVLHPKSGTPAKLVVLTGLGDKKKILVVNKSDLPQKLASEILKALAGEMSVVRTSCVHENGTDLLENEIFCSITKGQVQASDELVVSSVRQKALLEKTLQCIREAKLTCASGLSHEFLAVDIRHALGHLGALVGEVVTDDVLDQLFSQFCIGK